MIDNSERGGPREAKRARLVLAMTEAVARHGYPATTVAHVAAIAGLSRAAFYDCFPNKERCFLAAHDRAVGKISSEFSSASDSRTGSLEETLLDPLVRLVADDPSTARLLLVEAEAAGPRVRSRQDRFIADLERRVEWFLADGHPGAEEAVLIPAAALIGGVGSILSMRLLQRPEALTPVLAGELMSWLGSYRSDGETRPEALAAFRQMAGQPNRRSSRRLEAVDPLLPRGRSGLSEEVSAELRRKRIVDATARVTAEKGYASLTVADIVSAARVTRKVFYSHFRNKHEAFLAAKTTALRESIAAAAAEFAVGATWPERVWSGLSGMLEYLARHPALTHLEVLETHAAGRDALAHAHESRMAYSLFLEEGYRHSEGARQLPGICSEAIGGAIFGLLRHNVSRGRVDRIHELLPEAAYVALAPFLGVAPTIGFIGEKLATPDPAASPIRRRSRLAHPARG